MDYRNMVYVKNLLKGQKKDVRFYIFKERSEMGTNTTTNYFPEFTES